MLTDCRQIGFPEYMIPLFLKGEERPYLVEERQKSTKKEFLDFYHLVIDRSH